MKLTWKVASLLWSVGANTIFVFGLYLFLFIWPLMPGTYPMMLACEAIDPGNQPFRAACGGWYGVVAEVCGICLNVFIYWAAIYFIGRRRRTAEPRNKS